MAIGIDGDSGVGPGRLEPGGIKSIDIDLPWELERQGANHEIWRCASTRVPIPRHAEIADRLARRIFAELEDDLGVQWWRE